MSTSANRPKFIDSSSPRLSFYVGFYNFFVTYKFVLLPAVAWFFREAFAKAMNSCDKTDSKLARSKHMAVSYADDILYRKGKSREV